MLKRTEFKRKANRKRCSECKKLFTPSKSFQPTCSVPCAIEWAKSDAKVRVQKERLRKAQFASHRKELKAFNEKDRGWWVKETQKQFNKYIRLRDGHLPCVSCGRHHQGQYHAGHYRTIGSNPELRFDEDNCHKQCSACNEHLSGNLINYRIELLIRIGQERLNSLEGPHQPKKYIIDELRELRDHWKSECKKLEAL